MVEVHRLEDLFSFFINECRLSLMVPEEGPYITVPSCTLGVPQMRRLVSLQQNILILCLEHLNSLLHARTPVSIFLFPAEYLPLSVNPAGSFPCK